MTRTASMLVRKDAQSAHACLPSSSVNAETLSQSLFLLTQFWESLLGTTMTTEYIDCNLMYT
ncbi:hypothetical protein NC652_031698 [Populus alba x Populus x berolinensis]|uniref:Uncharacterized protein n=1 Tax=Populus alba x Populus x berolinensis TaxID=444605 RepID=A0AAD6LYK4_9ROSI|nr:hypothetical protein NC652_031698 [Populus alba x Populus x berolinensis]KAJ6975688.1 hypothetical protein NC653_031501 [Populus alba x Populus x berolinensis]